MKHLFFTFFITLLCTNGYAKSAKLWKELDHAKKEKLLDAYLEFYEEYSAQQIEPLAQLQPPTIFEFINSAYASSKMDCIYAGWPSKRVGGLCSTPVRHNPSYETGSCKSNELQCQPMLFGSGFCVPTNTQKQRSLAFSNCNQKFSQSGRTAGDVVSEIEKSGKQAELFEVMDQAQSICTSGKQATTAMCKRLLKVLETIKAEDIKSTPPKKEEEKAPTPPKVEEKIPTPPKMQLPPPAIPDVPKRKMPEVIIEGKKENDPKIADDFITSVKEADKINSTAGNTGVIMCETSEPLERINPRANSSSVGSKYVDGGYEYVYFQDSQRNTYDRGVRVMMRGPNKFAPMIEGEPTTRSWDFVSEDNSVNGTFINISDEPTPGTLSHLMETNIVLIPRKEKPRAETKGDEVHVTLPTGEMVIFDAKTKLIKRGAFTEEAIDTNPNRLKRKFVTSYAGEGISLKVDRRGNDPRIGAGNVEITQKGKTCSLPKAQVWGGTNDNPKFKFSDDKKLVDFLNSKCKSKFSL